MTTSTLPRLTHESLARLAAPFVAAGVLSAEDLLIVDLLASPAADDGEALLGLAFALRASRFGSVGVDLGRVGSRLLAEARAVSDDAVGGDALAALPWPDPTTWRARAMASDLVGDGRGEPRPFVCSGNLLLTRRHFRAQERLVAAIASRVARPGSVGPHPLDEALLAAGLERLFPAGPAGDAAEVRHATALAVTRALAVLTGGPGTGKTYAVKNVLALLAEQWLARLGRFPRVALAAPTGKAAVRLTHGLGEGLERLEVAPSIRGWLAGLAGVTLHRLLGARGAGAGFRHGADLPLPAEVVVVDEASMIDLPLVARLLDALPEGCRLVLAGDPDQLASVGVGTVLADLVSGLGGERPASSPVARLTRPRRFGRDSGLARLALALASGDAASLAQAAAWLAGEGGAAGAPLPDVTFVPHVAEGPSKALLAALVEGWTPVLLPALEGPAPQEPDEAWHARCLDGLARFRVLAAHRDGALGVSGLTRAVVQGLAAAAESARTDRARGGLARLRTTGELWVGQPVLVTENRADLGLMNGDVGIVVVDARGRRRVLFPGRATGVALALDPGRLPAHEPAFVHTVHRAQGSEYDTVCVVLPSRPSPLVTRELVYTAVTRARRRVLLAAEPALVAPALAQRVERASTLAESLRAAIARLTAADASGSHARCARSSEVP